MAWGRTAALVVLMGATAGAKDGAGPTGSEAAERTFIDASQLQVQGEQRSLAKIARDALPSVVSITTRPSARRAGGMIDEEPQQGIGSGFIVHPDGWILTSAHVVEEAAEVRITLSPDLGFSGDVVARIVGVDVRTDTALLKVDAGKKLPALALGSADALEVADWVVVIGNPFGLSQTVSVGVVSFKGRTDVMPGGRDIDFDYIQTDACINPGSSGGPVLDATGRVVAVANAVNVSGQGIGFAVPIDIPKAILTDLRKKGKVDRGWMGVTVQDLNPQLGASLGIPEAAGVVVSQVVADSPGARAGLRVGDVITRVDRTPVDRAHALRWRVSTRGVGAKVPLTARRAGKPFSVEIKLEPVRLGEEPITPAVGGSGLDVRPDPAPDTVPTPAPPGGGIVP